MPSTFGWIDFSEEERRKMVNVIHLFRERDTVDELGVGVIRDGLANLLFPGTTTIQTRVKYMLFVPWIYCEAERRRTSSKEIERYIRSAELKLVRGLLASGEEASVIGSDSKEKLKRWPSSIYWNGLSSWDIRRFSGSQDQYNRQLDMCYQAEKGEIKSDDGEVLETYSRPNWHSSLPAMPSDFPNMASFKLSRNEAQYLYERIRTCHPTSLFAHMIKVRRKTKTGFHWEHPSISSASFEQQKQVKHSRNFSEVLHGALLLFNFMLAQKSGNDKLEEKYNGMIENWLESVEQRGGELASWDRGDFWRVVDQCANPSIGTRHFVNRWIDLTSSFRSPKDILESKKARLLIEQREYSIKKSRARLRNQRALEMWGGASGTSQIDYRWKIVVNQMVNDIVAGLRRG